MAVEVRVGAGAEGLRLNERAANVGRGRLEAVCKGNERCKPVAISALRGSHQGRRIARVIVVHVRLAKSGESRVLRRQVNDTGARLAILPILRLVEGGRLDKSCSGSERLERRRRHDRIAKTKQKRHFSKVRRELAWREPSRTHDVGACGKIAI